MKKRLTAILLTGCMLAGTILSGVTAAAEETNVSAAAEEGAKLAPFTVSLPLGDRAEIIKPSAYKKVSANEIQEMDRAMRAFSPASDSLVKNNADDFYYYSQLDFESQGIYDAIMMLTEHPEEEGNFSLCLTGTDPSSDEFLDIVYTVFLAMTYDHPELFWMYNFSEVSIAWKSDELAEGSGLYTVFFVLDQTYQNYEKEMTAFNTAVEAFLADIDMSGSQKDIAIQIHDKLVSMVTYDDYVLENSANSGGDLAHTAYGALVANSRGDANTAVCDGYSLAYEYLLQQAGIECTFVGGSAGDNEATMGGHAWNIVNLDGQWYEVDSTWDDCVTGLRDALEELDHQSPEYYYYGLAIYDENYWNTITHYLFGVSTEEIRNYEPKENQYYFFDDLQLSITLLTPSVHVRDSEDMPLTPMGTVSGMTPVAGNALQ